MVKEIYNQSTGQTGRSGSLIAALVALICSVTMCHAAAETDPIETVALVNGEAVTCDELNFFLQHHRSKVYQHFHKNHGITDLEEFWNPETVFGKESPLGMLKELAIQELIHVKVQLQLARDEGLIRDTSIRGVMNLRPKENLRRAKALQSGRVIYGPREYNGPVFFDYFLSNLVIRLKERLLEKHYGEIVSQRLSRAEIRIMPAYYLMQVEW